jgi:Zn finger protein HypA/HybF involved in hydrogenase expression
MRLVDVKFMYELHGTTLNGFFTDSEYWDCSCDNNYIHKKSSGNYCPNCNKFMEEMPDSRELEIPKHYGDYSDKYIQHKVYEEA